MSVRAAIAVEALASAPPFPEASGRIRQKRLAIFPAPAMFDLLRERMPHSLRTAVILESGHNLVHQDEARLRAFVKSEIASPGDAPPR